MFLVVFSDYALQIIDGAPIRGVGASGLSWPPSTAGKSLAGGLICCPTWPRSATAPISAGSAMRLERSHRGEDLLALLPSLCLRVRIAVAPVDSTLTRMPGPQVLRPVPREVAPGRPCSRCRRSLPGRPCAGARSVRISERPCPITAAPSGP